ncbi:hypothetical protein FOA52_001105 [Chlamydomonas sp. UWO 241]|nr:hypothetical protein FOA52_001105 [Chlamydomonas sp. UWO 241]
MTLSIAEQAGTAAGGLLGGFKKLGGLLGKGTASSGGAQQSPASAATAAVEAAAEMARARGLAMPAPSAQLAAEAASAARAAGGVNPGVSLLVLQALAEAAGDADVPTSEFVAQHVTPVTEGTSKAYVELLEEGQSGPARLYVSHAKGMPWADLVSIVDTYVSWKWPEAAHEDFFVWVDVLCRRAVGASGTGPPSVAELLNETRRAIAACDGPTLLCADGDGAALGLAWVQYELWATARAKGGAHVRVMCEEVLTLGHVTRALRDLKPRAAKAPDAEHVGAIVDELRREGGAEEDLHAVLAQVLLQAANAEAQDLASSGLQDQATMAYLASALHKCAVFASACGVQGAAEELGRQSTALMRRTMGDDDGLVAATRLGLAEVLLASGKLEEAEAEYRAAVPLQAATQGDDNPDTLRAVRQLALCLKRQGKFAEAEAHYTSNLQYYEALYGQHSTNYAAGLLHLVVLHAKSGTSESTCKASSLGEQALSINEALLGPSHDTTLQSLQLCKNVARKAGDRAAWDRHAAVLKERVAARAAEGSA